MIFCDLQISPGAREVLFVFYLPKGLIVGSIAENSADFRNAILTKIRSARFELLAFRDDDIISYEDPIFA